MRKLLFKRLRLSIRLRFAIHTFIDYTFLSDPEIFRNPENLFNNSLSKNIESKAIITSLLDPLLRILANDDDVSTQVRQLIQNSRTNDIKLTDAKNALDRALETKFQNVILDKRLDGYYNQWSRGNYSESNWATIFQHLRDEYGDRILNLLYLSIILLFSKPKIAVD